MSSDQGRLFNPATWNALRAFNIKESTLNDIAKACPTLVDMFEKFVSQGGKFAYSTAGSFGYVSSNYDYMTHTVNIYMPFVFADDQWQATVHLAHEVGHALSATRLNETSASSLALSSSLWEGEAMFYEFLAFNQIYPDKAAKKEYLKVRWLDNETQESTDNLYVKMHQIIYGYNPIGTSAPTGTPQITKEKIERLAELNREFRGGLIGNGKITITYDEKMKWSWLKKYTYISIDMMEMGGPDLISRNKYRSDAFNMDIERGELASSLIKILVNQAHKGRPAIDGNLATDYFGTENDEILRAEKNGSVLGNFYGYECLWGGGGKDIIYGSTKKDYLFDGDGDDCLYGESGDDYLAGNLGDDYLYGGDGSDQLYGGQGDDYLYGDGGPSPNGGYFIWVPNPGKDFIFGGDGNDCLVGGEDADQLYGDGYNLDSGKNEML